MSSSEFLKPSDQPFRLRLQRSGVVLEVPAGESALSVLLRNGIDAAHTCGFGTCGSCVTPVLGGTPDHRDKVLSAELKQTNRFVALCVSRSQTPELIIDF